MSVISTNVGTAVGYLDLDINGFISGLNTAQSQAQGFTNQLAGKVSTGFTNVGNTLSSVGNSLLKTVTVPLVALGTLAFKTAADFDSGMAQVKAITQTTGAEFDQLKNKALDLSKGTVFSATEVANGMTEMAKAGWGATQIMDGMSGVLSAATASGEDLATVSTIMADAITGFGLSASDSTRVADLLTQAANSGTISVSDLGESFKYIAPISKTMGFSIEETTTAITALSTAGIKGSQAGTTLRTMLTNLAAPTDEVKGAMEELELSVTNQDGSFKSLSDIVGTMRTKFNGLTDEQKTYYATTIAGKEGMSGLLTLLGMTQEEYDKIAVSMNNANGVAEETAKVMSDNLSSKVKMLVSSLQNLAIVLIDVIKPYIEQVIAKITEWADNFAKLDEGTQKTILKFLAFAAVAPIVLIAIGKISLGIGALIKVIDGVPKAIAGMKAAFTGLQTMFINFGEASALSKAGFTALAGEASPLYVALAAITPAMAAIAAVAVVLVAAFVTLWQTSEQFRNAIGLTFKEMGDSFNAFQSEFVSKINELGFNFTSITDVLGAAWLAFCSVLAPIFVGAFQIVSNALDGIFGVILGIMDIFIGTFTGDWERAFSGFGQVLQSVWDGIIGLLGILLNTFGNVLNVFLGAFGTSWQEVWGNIVQPFADGWNAVLGFFAGVAAWFATIPAIFQQVVTDITTFFAQLPENINIFFSQLPYLIGLFLGQAIGNIILFNMSVAQAVLEMGTNFINTVVNFFTQLPGNIENFLNSAINNVRNWVSNMGSNAQSAGSNFVNNVINTVQALPGNLMNLLNSALNQVYSWAGGLANAGANGARSLYNAVVNGVAGLPGAMASIGSNIVDGVWSGIQAAAGWFTSSVSSFFSGIVDGVKSTLGINSPSKVFANIVGAGIVEGSWKGVKDNWAWFLQSIKQAYGSITDSIDTPVIDVGLTTNTDALATSMQALSTETDYWLGNIETKLANSLAKMFDLTGALNNDIVLSTSTDEVPPLYVTFKDTVVNGYDDVKKLGRDLYNAQQDYARGKGVKA